MRNNRPNTNRRKQEHSKQSSEKSTPNRAKRKSFKQEKTEKSWGQKRNPKVSRGKNQEIKKDSEKKSTRTTSRASKSSDTKKTFTKPKTKQEIRRTSQPSYDTKKINRPKKKGKESSDLVRLNKYIANAGICSRREADELIQQGKISVNGKVVSEMGYQVKPNDEVKYGKTKLKRESFVYVLLNKPKDFITTMDDPENRKTVMALIANACNERIYPVGRLDRDTTGLLLFTNDGELTQKLTHPSHEVSKIYQVELHKPMAPEDLKNLFEGVLLDDGIIMVDDAALLNKEKTSVGIEIHSGRNRIIRRIFEHLGYQVNRLDRTMYAGLNKKDLPRGKWRFLSEKEVIRIKYFS